jgi:hypothetical protein
MAVTKLTQRKVVEIAYDTNLVKGETVSINAGPNAEEVRDVPNHGTANVTFPGNFTSLGVAFEVQGSHEGVDTGSVPVD